MCDFNLFLSYVQYHYEGSHIEEEEKTTVENELYKRKTNEKQMRGVSLYKFFIL